MKVTWYTFRSSDLLFYSDASLSDVFDVAWFLSSVRRAIFLNLIKNLILHLLSLLVILSGDTRTLSVTMWRNFLGSFIFNLFRIVYILIKYRDFIILYFFIMNSFLPQFLGSNFLLISHGDYLLPTRTVVCSPPNSRLECVCLFLTLFGSVRFGRCLPLNFGCLLFFHQSIIRVMYSG